MRKVIILTLVMVQVCIMAKAQSCTIGKTHSLEMNIELNALTSLRNKNVTQHGYNMDAAFSLYRGVSLLGSVETISYHSRMKAIRTYYNDVGLAGGLALNVVDGENTTVPVKIKVGRTVGHPDWKNYYYDTSIAINQRIGKSNVAAVAGLGYRFVKSQSAQMTDHGFVYAFIGVKL